jgi:hypothetical protein
MKSLRDITSALSRIFRGSQLEVAFCGIKKAKLEDCPSVSSKTGFWEEASRVTSKPLRWLVHYSPHLKPAVHFPMHAGNEHMGARRLGYANTTKAITAAVGIRVVPVLAFGGFKAREDLETLLLLMFTHTLPAGSSGQVVECLDSLHGTVNYLGRAVQVERAIIFPVGSGFQRSSAESERYLEGLLAFIRGSKKGSWATVCRSDKSEMNFGSTLDQICRLVDKVQKPEDGSSRNQRQGAAHFTLGKYHITVGYSDKQAASEDCVMVDVKDHQKLLATVNAKHPFVEAARRVGNLNTLTQYALVEAVCYDLASRAGSNFVTREMREQALRIVGLASVTGPVSA